MATEAMPDADSDGGRFLAYRDRPITIGSLVFPGMDQIDFTGPFEVLTRLPDSEIHVIGTQAEPFRDMHGLVLTPDLAFGEAPELDLLHVAGGPGQQDLMDNKQVLAFIRDHFQSGKLIFSVCTGALLCGAAGILKDRRATTHWSAGELLPYFGAISSRERVVIDDTIISAAGVTAGIDGALRLSALVRGEATAQAIQLDIQYAPVPPFDSGSPETAPPAVLEQVKAKYHQLTKARVATAMRITQQNIEAGLRNN